MLLNHHKGCTPEGHQYSSSPISEPDGEFAIASRACFDGRRLSGDRGTRWAGCSGIAKRADPEFDLIVTNTWLPGLSGSELIALLRQDFPKVPILHIDDISRHKAGEFPQEVTTLYKPFNVAALRQAVRELLQA